MKKILFVVILSIPFLFGSCKKHYEKGDDDGAPPYITNPTSYILKSVVTKTAESDGFSYSFSYNKDHLIMSSTRVNRTIPATTPGFYSTINYTFEYTGGLCSKVTEHQGEADITYTYEYNSDKQLVESITTIADRPDKSYSFYKYDALNHLIEERDSSGGTGYVFYKIELAYNSDGNLVSAFDSEIFPFFTQVSKKEWSAFDSKINYVKTVNGLPPFFPFLPEQTAFKLNFISGNKSNPVTETTYFLVAEGQPFSTTNTTSNIIEYNEDNLPVSIFSAGWTTTLEYEKYK